MIPVMFVVMFLREEKKERVRERGERERGER